jgi:2-amino-4-hydroxy-6-hydroxymethyldihydropteridine diphosphokinase
LVRPVSQEVRTYIGLGSNVGDRRVNLANAREALREIGRIATESSIYETEPWGVSGPQPDYLNQVVCLFTKLTPRKLLGALLEIETRLGRKRKDTGEPRVIDLDLLLYGADRVDEPPDLVVPHPRMHERAFVLVPLAEIAPNVYVAGTSKSVADLAKATGSNGVRKLATRVKGQSK